MSIGNYNNNGDLVIICPTRQIRFKTPNGVSLFEDAVEIKGGLKYLDDTEQITAFTTDHISKLEVINLFGAETQIVTGDTILKLDPGTAHMSLYSDHIYFGNASGTNLHINGQIQNNAFTNSYIVDITTAKDKLEPITVNEFDFTFNKNVIIESPNTLTINDEIQNYAFTDDLRDKVNFNHSTYSEIQNNETDMTINKQLIINSNFETLTLQGDKIIFNDSSQQDTAFTGSHASKLGLIIESFNGRYQLMSTGSGFEKIEINAESMFLKRGGVLYGEIGALTPTNELHINSYNNKDIILNPGTADIQLLNDVHIGNELYIGGEIQTKAFTDADHLHLTSLILPNSKIHIEFDVQWDVLNLPDGLTLEPRIRYTNSGYYDITGHDDLLLYTQYYSAVQRTWIGGPKKLRIKYTMNFRSRKGRVDYFKSQLVQYDNNINVFKKVSLFNGRDNYGEFDLLEWIFYNDDMIVNIDDGDSLKLYTQWKFIPPDETMDINCRFVIEEL